MSTFKANSTEQEVLEKCCNSKGVDIKDIYKLLDAEEEFKVKSKRRGISSRLLDEVKTIIENEDENNSFTN